MKENIWTASDTHNTVALNSRLGSPRAWLKRALDISTLQDLTFPETSLAPQEITVGAIWYRPCALPQIAEPTLYRFFDIPPLAEVWNTRKTAPAVAAIGVGCAVKFKDILPTVKHLRLSGAAFTWWSRPGEKPIAICVKPRRTKIDHAAVIELLKSGHTRNEIARYMDINANNVDYIRAKWIADPSYTTSGAKGSVDKAAILQDYLSGMRGVDIAIKYERSEAYIYRLIATFKKAA